MTSISDLPPPPEISSIPEVPSMPVEPVSPQTVKEESSIISEPKKNGLLNPDQITIIKRIPGTRVLPKPFNVADSKGGGIKNPGNAIPATNISGNSDGGAGAKGDPNADDSYYSVIGAFLKSRWAKPSQNTLGGKLPEVHIELSIDASGKIISSRIVSASGVNAMDMSVKALLRNLTEVPKPPRQMTFQVLMRIED